MTRKTIKFVLTLAILASSLSMYSNAEAKMDYNEVRQLTQRSCHPLCNLTEYDASTSDVYTEYDNYYGYNQYSTYNQYGYYQYPTYNQYPSYNQYGYNPYPTTAYNNQNPYVAPTNTSNNTGIVPTAYANNGANTQPTYAYNTQNDGYGNAIQTAYASQYPIYSYQNTTPVNNPSALSKSGIGNYMVFPIVILLSSGIVLYIRRKRKDLFNSISV